MENCYGQTTFPFPAFRCRFSSFSDSCTSTTFTSPRNSRARPELVGVCTGNNTLLVQWQKNQNAKLRWRSWTSRRLCARNRYSDRRLAGLHALGESTLAVSHDGTMAAIAVKLDNAPTILIYNLRGASKQATVPIGSLDSRAGRSCRRAWPSARTIGGSLLSSSRAAPRCFNAMSLAQLALR